MMFGASVGKAPRFCSFSVVMTQQGIEQSGQLDLHPLAELIRETSANGLSGAFRLARERVKSVVYFDAGALVFAVSNLRLHRLAECARRWNFVTAQQLQDVGQTASDTEMAKALVESGALTKEKLAELLSLQATDVLRPALLWIDGAWSFDPRVRLAEDVNASIPVRELLIESARRLPPEFVAGRFGNTNEKVSIASGPPNEVEMQPIEAFVLSRIDATGMRLHELTAVSGLSEADTLRSLYALALGGFVERDMWPRAFTDERVARFKAANAAAAKKAAQEEADATAAEAEQPVREEVVVAAAATPPPVVESAPPELDERQELEQFLSRLGQAEDHYEVLGVTRTAEANAIKRAYHALARRYHPDRFHQEAGTPLHTQLQTAFARIAQAYETLKDARARASYNLRLEAQRKMSRAGSFSNAGTVSQSDSRQQGRVDDKTAHTNVGQSGAGASVPKDAEESFQRGLAALKMGNTALAIPLLGEAARLAPGQARYRAYYGRSLASHKQTRHQAEAEMQAAINLDSNNASYRVMLAQLYFDLGMKRRAQGEAQRAVSIDPQNAEALRLLNELR
jgi:DnaJ-class molecular chaperone with C-terminal Zn finger domain